MAQRRRGRVFLSYMWANETEVDAIKAALKARGVSVFRDKDIESFIGDHRGVAARAGAFDLVAGFLLPLLPDPLRLQVGTHDRVPRCRTAGQPPRPRAAGQPGGRREHLAPIDLEDAAYFTWTRDADVDRLADRVVAKLDADDRVPFGSLPTTAARTMLYWLML